MARIRIVSRMLQDLISGPKDTRITAAVTLGMWFAIGGFITSTATDYVIPFLHGNLTSVAGGILTVILAALATAKVTA